MTEPNSNGGQSKEEEQALWRRAKSNDGRRAREALFELYYPYATGLARRHFLDRRSGDIELADLRQLASAGLLEAIDAFDPDRGVPFRGFARRRISGSILDGLSKMSELREQLSHRSRVRAERMRSLSAEMGNLDAGSSDDALRALLDLAVGLALGFMLDDTGLYVPGERADPLPNAYDSLVWKDMMTAVSRSLAELPPRERGIIENHYLRGMPFSQIADLAQLSKGRVSQLHSAALGLLQRRLAAARHFSLER